MLTFSSNGTFTIAHYTDLHIAYPNGEADTRTLTDFKASLLTLEADLIILTGDQIWCFEELTPSLAYQQLIDCLNLVDIPVIVTYGNHDSEHGKITRHELRQLEQQLKNRAVPTASHLTQERLSEYYPIYAADKQEVVKQLVVFDSGDYLTEAEAAKLPVNTTNYAYLYPEQLNWFDEVVTTATDELLVFMHIPLAEYHESKHFLTSGVAGELSGASVINSGLFARLLAKKTPTAVFCGHDHDNTFTSEYLGIQLNYGLISGYNVYGPEKRGFRQIDLHVAQPLTTALSLYQ